MDYSVKCVKDMCLRTDICPICHREIDERWPVKIYDHGRTALVFCSFCGNLQITGNELITELTCNQMIEKKPDLEMSIALRQVRPGAYKAIKINKENYDDIKQSVTIPSDPNDKLDLLMLHCMSKANRAGEVTIPYSDITLLYIRDRDEMEAILNMASELGLIKDSESQNDNYSFSLTHKGWLRIVLLYENGRPSRKVFVAMKFGDDKLDEVYKKAIVPAIENCGYQASRIDNVHHNDKICDKIESEIKESAFVVADFTGHRGGVYFEAGYAKALHIPVIFTCRDDDFAHLHFDTRQYNHIKWKSYEDLKTKLEDRINETIVKDN